MPSTEYPCSAQLIKGYQYSEAAQQPNIPAVPNHRIFQSFSTAECPHSIPAAQPQSIAALPSRRRSLHCPKVCVSQKLLTLNINPLNPRVSLLGQSLSACTAQPKNLPAAPNLIASLLRPTHPLPQSFREMRNFGASLACPTLKHKYEKSNLNTSHLTTPTAVISAGWHNV